METQRDSRGQSLVMFYRVSEEAELLTHLLLSALFLEGPFLWAQPSRRAEARSRRGETQAWRLGVSHYIEPEASRKEWGTSGV